MASDELVSVVMPAYNHEKFVGQAIESVINQTYGPIELLIIDDGSSDRTWDIIRGLQPACEKRFRRVIFKRQENRGTCLTLNRLLDDISGRYVTSISSDDLMAPALVEESLFFLEENSDYGVVYFDAGLIDEQSQNICWNQKRDTVEDPEGAEYSTIAGYLRKRRPDVDFLSPDFGSYESLLKGNYIPTAPFHRRELLEKTGFYKEAAPLEDWYMAIQMAKYARSKFIDKPLRSYRWHPSNTARITERMRAMTQATLRYEINQVQASGDEAALARLHRCFRRTKTIFGGDKIRLYKTKSFDGKKIVLKIMSSEFAFTYKSGRSLSLS